MISQRVRQMGSAIFAELNEWKAEAISLGRDLIDLSIGSPDLPPSELVMDALRQAVSDPANYGYPTSQGSQLLRTAMSRWMKHRFGVELDPEREVLALTGSQDGLGHMALAFADSGDTAIVPNPGYPIYSAGLKLAGVEPYLLPLREENDYLPDLEKIPASVAHKAVYMLLNYPSNPLSATADLDFFERWIAFCRRYDILAVHDLAYSEMGFDGLRPPSVLQIPGARKHAVEYHSMSKSFNMAGCRMAFLVGNPDALDAMRMLKSNIDFGTFYPVQIAAAKALDADCRVQIRPPSIYEQRRDVFVAELAKQGWMIPKPRATMFVWARNPLALPSRQISREMLLNTGVALVPGDAFGSEGEGYCRMALVQEEERLRIAAMRIGEWVRTRRESEQ